MLVYVVLLKSGETSFVKGRCICFARIASIFMTKNSGKNYLILIFGMTIPTMTVDGGTRARPREGKAFSVLSSYRKQMYIKDGFLPERSYHN